MTVWQKNSGNTGRGPLRHLRTACAVVALGAATVSGPTILFAQNYSFSQVKIEGNDRIEPATILSFAAISRGKAISAGELNAALQRIQASGLFESVEVVPSGGTLVIKVVENPTINVVSFEGNKRLKDENLASIVQSQSRKVYSAATAEADAAKIVEAYTQAGRLAARVDPKIIKRDGNRVDLAFEIREGAVTEVERLSFTGNRAFSDRRLRQVLETKQAGILRRVIQRDTFVADRVEFDKQLLTDFYRSRGYIDAQVLGVSSELSRERNAFFLTFNVREGQRYAFNQISTVSEIEGLDAADFQDTIKIRPGVVYSPTALDTAISRMEALALEKNLNFVQFEPEVIRNERDQTLDVVFHIKKGPRVFVERIDIEGNTTTLDRVVRRQFKTVEGDPFNPREIRNSAERVRALGFFAKADVNTRPGTAADQVVVDVNVEEQPTGSLSFGASYGVNSGPGIEIALKESNFLGRGQYVAVSIATASDTQNNSLTFIEPYVFGRDLKFKFNAFYNTSSNDNSYYSTKMFGFSPALEFPVSDNGRLELRYSYSSDELFDVDAASSQALINEQGTKTSSGFGYTYSYDTRVTGLNPNAGILLRFGQDYAGIGGDIEAITTTALVQAQTKVMQEEVTLRAEFEAGALSMLNGQSSRVTERFSGNNKIRGFESRGYGPRDLNGNYDALGGNFFAAARFEAAFPVGLPEEYGITGGAFLDFGSVWGLNSATASAANTLGGSDDMHIRSAIGLSVFWTTPIGPLRFNFSKALMKEDYDLEQNFDLTISTQF
ncbi:outer membrane protein assembly factor BamA [Phaeovulum sp. W22_SRMD_FR3]|uniref:outer membrane protein assembly factor BamA n=1 Tax=Phaeovulum sp. W22_SRMD_FR3 TaxID=3240274 RepID=UPI003F96CB70